MGTASRITGSLFAFMLLAFCHFSFFTLWLPSDDVCWRVAIKKEDLWNSFAPSSSRPGRKQASKKQAPSSEPGKYSTLTHTLCSLPTPHSLSSTPYSSSSYPTHTPHRPPLLTPHSSFTHPRLFSQLTILNSTEKIVTTTNHLLNPFYLFLAPFLPNRTSPRPCREVSRRAASRFVSSLHSRQEVSERELMKQAQRCDFSHL